MANIDHEHIYKLIQCKQWLEALNNVSQYFQERSPDELTMGAVQTFEDMFFAEIEKDILIDNVQFILERLVMLYKVKFNELSEDRYRSTSIELVKIYSKQGLDEQAYSYARNYPEDETYFDAITLHQNSLPKIIEHSQSEQIRVTENRNIADENHTTSLFKSSQEIEFFMAVREVYPMFTAYPNVALSCVVNFDKIKDKLSSEEKVFFFKGIIDCVVFDQHNSYKPTKFFELDSSYHDSSKQQQKDSYKDNILSLAGQKLYRVRKTSANQGRVEFIKLIREIEL
jgi:hypothetical protein